MILIRKTGAKRWKILTLELLKRKFGSLCNNSGLSCKTTMLDKINDSTFVLGKSQFLSSLTHPKTGANPRSDMLSFKVHGLKGSFEAGDDEICIPCCRQISFN
uniref:Uncharacterized protein n=1 Tax=Romanomermis culicivorax TaxID=13658 RepID=A0A915K3P8_ROMCU